MFTLVYFTMFIWVTLDLLRFLKLLYFKLLRIILCYITLRYLL